MSLLLKYLQLGIQYLLLIVYTCKLRLIRLQSLMIQQNTLLGICMFFVGWVSAQSLNPVAERDSVLFNLSSSLCSSVNVLKNDSSVSSNDSLYIVAFDSLSVNSGTVSKIGDSTLCYHIWGEKLAIDSFTYTVCDGQNNCSVATVIVTMPVVAYNDEDSAFQGETTVIDVKLNDVYGNVDTVEVLLWDAPVHGHAITSGKEISYTPYNDYPPAGSDYGTDSLRYILCSTINGQPYCDYAMLYLTVLPKKTDASLFVAAGISPNGDGINDELVLTPVGADARFFVYNRYGDKVWESRAGYPETFKGRDFHDNSLPDGTYFYIYRFNNGIDKDISGYIIINR